MTILIVDDEAIAIDGIIINSDFEKLGIHTVCTANSMDQAAELIASRKIDILICDIEMPNGSGLELLEWVHENNPSIVSIILSCHSEFLYAQQAINLACIEYILKPATPAVLDSVLTKAVQYVEQRNSDSRYKEFGEEYIRRIAGTEDADIGCVEKVCRYIKDHIEEELVVEELAKQAFMSSGYLTRCFKKQFGSTVIDYITKYRMSLSEELLKNTDLTITSISAKVGYQNYAYFTKQFKKYSGFSPREYRNHQKNK